MMMEIMSIGLLIPTVAVLFNDNDTKSYEFFNLISEITHLKFIYEHFIISIDIL